MSKIKNFDRSLYNSISEGVYSFVKAGERKDCLFPVYSKGAVDDALAFLCLNDIAHSISKTEVGPNLAKCDINSLILLSWDDCGAREHLAFWSDMEVEEDD